MSYENTTVSIEAKTEASTPTGGRTKGLWTVVNVSFRCRFEQMSAYNIESHRARRIVATHVFFSTTNPKVVANLHSFVYQGRRFIVRYVDDVQQMGRQFETVAEEIQGL